METVGVSVRDHCVTPILHPGNSFLVFVGYPIKIMQMCPTWLRCGWDAFDLYNERLV